MNCITDYLSRIGKSRGFGIQSPWAYSMVTDVIMEPLPYYAYEEIDGRYADKWERKREKLYFRLRNFQNGKPMRILDLNGKTPQQVLDIARAMPQDGLLILENINHSPQTKALWQSVKADSAIGITFDLRRIALCFMPCGRIKQHYKLNF